MSNVQQDQNPVPIQGHTVSAYDREMQGLTDIIVQMGGAVGDLIGIVQQALVQREKELLSRAREQDRQINQLEYEIENKATMVLALRNPVAVDLRYVTSALKVSGTLERMGDLAKNVVKRCSRLDMPIPQPILKELEQLGLTVSEMLRDAITAIKERNPQKALAVWQRDDEADELCHDAYVLIKAQMKEDPDNAGAYIAMLLIARSLERFGDYASNMTKTVHYVSSGVQVSQQSPEESESEQAG